MKKAEAIKKLFSTPERPVTNKELMELVRTDKEGYDELAEKSAKALGEKLEA